MGALYVVLWVVWGLATALGRERGVASTYERYSVTEAVRQIMAYFASEGEERAPGIPPWDEFVLKAQEYGIL